MKIDTSISTVTDCPSPGKTVAGARQQRRISETGGISNVARRTVEKRAYAVREDSSIIDLRVVDLSYDGCRVETVERLVPGELLQLSVLGGGFVKATVRWYKDRTAGLLFDPDELPSTYRERDTERLHVTLQITLRRAGRIAYPVQTSDVSVMGCKCEFVERPSIGERVWVKFVGLQAVEAEVCWLADAKVGLKFRTPIHPAVFELLLDRFRP